MRKAATETARQRSASMRICFLLALSSLVGVVRASTGVPCEHVEVGPPINVAVGKSTVFRPSALIARIVMGNPSGAVAAQPREEAKLGAGAAPGAGAVQGGPDIRRPNVADIDVLLLSAREIYVLGKSLGSTNFVLVDPTGQCTVVDVNVSMDTVAVAATLHELMPNETRIRVSAAADSIVLSGVVSDGPAVERAMDIAMSFTRKAGDTSSKSAQARIVNLLSVTSPQQVMLEVKVAEVDKTILDQFGIDFTRAYASGDGSMMRFLSGVFGGAGLLGLTVSGATGATVGAGAVGTQTNGLATTAGSAPNGNSVSGSPPTIPLVNGKSFTSLTGNMQRQDALVKVLAEPNVMAISGQEGSFLAGGKILIPITQAANGLTTITLQEMEYGVSLRFTPTVLADGRINLKVNPEVSELSATGTAVSAGSTTSVLPTFTTRRVQTTVQLMDGQSFAIGGLISNNVTSSIQAFPFLADIPIIGALFRSTSFQGDRSELVIVITPRLVKPLGPQFPLPTDAYVPPSRTDLILNGKLEGKNPADAIGGSDDHHHVLDPVSPTK